MASGCGKKCTNGVVNANFNLNVHPTPLMSDFSDCALDEGGASDPRRTSSVCHPFAEAVGRRSL